ncbi:MAG: DUF2339 domain-containing protein, partial [Pseudonocardiales bacterium]
MATGQRVDYGDDAAQEVYRSSHQIQLRRGAGMADHLGMTRPGTPEPSLSRLADELTAVGERLAWIGYELRQVDAAARAYQAVPAPPPADPAGPTSSPMAAPPLDAPISPPWTPVPSTPRKPGLLEREGASSRLLAWVGGAVTLLGVLLLLVLAVQRGWLGPLPRVLGGAALAVALIGVGVAVHRRPAGQVGGVVLAATGFAALYLDTVAATVLYGYLPSWAGLAVGLLVAAAGLALADRWQAEPLAIAVVAGAAVLAPVITGLDPVPLVGFLLVLQVAATLAQLRRPVSGGCGGIHPPPTPGGAQQPGWGPRA